MIGHGVYLICFETRFKHAGHYLGWASNIDRRIAEHRRAGPRCAKLLAAVNRAGIDWEVVRIWPGLEKDDECRLKNRGGKARLCPRCRARASVVGDR